MNELLRIFIQMGLFSLYVSHCIPAGLFIPDGLSPNLVATGMAVLVSLLINANTEPSGLFQYHVQDGPSGRFYTAGPGAVVGNF